MTNREFYIVRLSKDYRSNPDIYLDEAQDVINDEAGRRGGSIRASDARKVVKKRFKEASWIRNKVSSEDQHASEGDIDLSIEEFVDSIFDDVVTHVNGYGKQFIRSF